jgi:ADP-ribose pyrophosphatase
MKIKSIKKITDLRHLNLFSIQYLDQNNKNKNWIFASRSSSPNPLEKTGSIPDAVVVVAFHEIERKLVLIKEYRVALGGYQHGFPAGLVDKGETIEETAKRELLEETGLSMSRIIKISPPVFSSSGMTDEAVSLVFAECQGSPSNRFNEASEDIETVMVSEEEALALMKDPAIKWDVKTWIVLNSFSVRGNCSHSDIFL